MLDLSYLSGATNEDIAKIEHVKRGAIESGINVVAAKAMELFCLPDDKVKLSSLLFALETSVGCFLLTGYFAPFSRLSLRDRERALLRMKRAMIVPVRAGYQVTTQ